MIAARASPMLRHNLPRVVTLAMQRQSGVWSVAASTAATSTLAPPRHNYHYYSTTPCVQVVKLSPHHKSTDNKMLFSSRADVVRSTPGHVTKQLRVLDMDVVKHILEELRSVDVNNDGRYEPNGLFGASQRFHNRIFFLCQTILSCPSHKSRTPFYFIVLFGFCYAMLCYAFVVCYQHQHG